MNNARTIVFLLLGIALLVVFDYMLRERRGGSEIVRRAPLFNRNCDYTRVAIASPRLKSPLVLAWTNAQWRIVAPFEADVDAPSVARFVDALPLAVVQDVLNEEELVKLGRKLADYELESPQLTVRASAPTEDACVAFGGFTPSGKGVYASVEGARSVYVVASNVFAMLNVAGDAFRRRELLDLDADEVLSVEVKRPTTEPLVLTRQGEHWSIGGEMAASVRVRDFVSALTMARAQAFVWPTGGTNESDKASSALLALYGLDPDSATTITLRGCDGAEHHLLLGLDAGDGLVYAQADDGHAIVTVSGKLLDAAQQDRLAFSDSRIFPYEPTTINAFSIADGETSYVIARGEAGSWRLDAPIVAPADARVAAGLLDKVLALTSADIVTEGVRVSVSTNLPVVTVSADRLLVDGRLAQLRSREIIRIDPQLVRRLIVSRGDQKNPQAVVYGRERRAWMAESSENAVQPVEKNISQLLNALNPLVAERVEQLCASSADLARYGLSASHLAIAIDQDRENAVRRNILIGARTKGGRYATVGVSDAIFVISDAVVEALSAQIVE